VTGSSAGNVPTTAPSDQEVVRTLAELFYDRELAQEVIADAGLERYRQPGWSVTDSHLFWSQVHRLFLNGAVVGGWPKVLREALKRRPANGVLRAAAAAAGVADAAPAGPASATGTADAAPAGAGPAAGLAGVEPAGSDPATESATADSSTASARRSPGAGLAPFAVFASYPHQAKSGGALAGLFGDLRDQIATRTGAPVDQTLFLDADMPVGGQWFTRINHALATCRVFMPVYAPAYRKSDFCGREWTIFARRVRDHVNRTGDIADVVIPILWTPPREIPWLRQSPFDSIQYISSHEQFARYRERGLLGLNDDDRKEIIFYLVTRIVEAYNAEPVPTANLLPDRAAFDELPTWESV